MNEAIATHLTRGFEDGLFANAHLHVTWPNGTLSYRWGEAVWFDLASLTKPLVTGALTAWSLQQKSLALEDRAAHWITSWEKDDRNEITIAQLLTHTSGLPPYREWYRNLSPDADATTCFEAILTEPMQTPPAIRTQYSDTGYIALAWILTRVLPYDDLAEAFAALVLPPNMTATEPCYGPLPSSLRSSTASTGYDTWRQRTLIGEVHDRHAFLLGRRAGHAGLFGTAAAVSDIADAWLHQRALGYLTEESVAWASKTAPIDGGDGRRWIWDRVTDGGSQAGTGMSEDTFGHLGFTGVSLWIDRGAGVAVTLLTDRVAHDSEGDRFRAWRPALHTALWRAVRTGNLHSDARRLDHP